MRPYSAQSSLNYLGSYALDIVSLCQTMITICRFVVVLLDVRIILDSESAGDEWRPFVF